MAGRAVWPLWNEQVHRFYSKNKRFVKQEHADSSDRKVIISKCRYPDGITVDVESGPYTGLTWVILKDKTATTRNDIEMLFDDLPEPIDLVLDRNGRILYWTDRVDPPRGNTVNRGRIEEGEQKKYLTPEILLTHLTAGIGIALDLKGNRMLITDLGCSIYSAKINGSDKKMLLAAQGIAYYEGS